MNAFLNKKINNQYCHPKFILGSKDYGFRIKSGMTGCCETGRSMVEMLGVLAVIGVLSVAGIVGYSIAMRSYRTNEIVNAASMFYVLAKAQNAGNGPSGNTDYTTLGGTNPSGATLAYTNNAFTITFTDTDDCTMAANKLGDKASADCANKTITVNFGEATAIPTETDYSIDENNIVTCKSGTVLFDKQNQIRCIQSNDEIATFCDNPSTCYGPIYTRSGITCYDCLECC